MCSRESLELGARQWRVVWGSQEDVVNCPGRYALAICITTLIGMQYVVSGVRAAGISRPECLTTPYQNEAHDVKPKTIYNRGTIPELVYGGRVVRRKLIV